MRAQLLTAREYSEKNKRKNESELQYFNRVMAYDFDVSYQVLYRNDKYVAKTEDGLMLLHLVEWGKDAD